MTAALWEVLIPALAALCIAMASWLHSQVNRGRIEALERSQRQGDTPAVCVRPHKEG